MNHGRHNIYYADGDLKSTRAVQAVLDRADAAVSCFTDPEECLKAIRDAGCRLLVTNVPEPAVEGIKLLTRVRHIAPWLPVIMLVEPGQIDTAVQAMKAGATDCLERPPQTSRLLAAVNQALHRTDVTTPSKPLTEVEQAVLHLVLEGKTNGEIAAGLHRSRRTVEVHRANIMTKLGARHIVDLVRHAGLAGLTDK
ncbi:MAG: LuxR C-terminal-related transcriptional regulator [Sedimentisphaerales bacterium]|jgi:two-component system response regulator FixJ|nr:LuxR C-terminal-related transcriptional regulator [Sedimentisphaerales bacterium]NLZ07698.1 response regulator [Phycisphaerae bacterium]HNY76744.1 LuxR C-terminal-related transcriptional regulator [Sedimentisphaerales bacterium]HOC61649.1 LuxR C-terminal-related transcriptional regulator [Sedimentisphaerales bacterium]HOH62481.1 LuxR C-terminal-related transcriptional regulator [Sedimentisphaerales bacterium]